MSKAFVTGSTGFIGSHLVEALLRKQYKIKCLVRKSANLKWIAELPVEIVHGDLFNKDLLLNAVKDVDYIFHIAGVTASLTKEGYFAGNVEATRNLLEAGSHNKNLKRFVFAGSLTAMGPAVNNIPPDENSPCNPITTYGKSKLEAEKEVLKFKDKIPITVLRLPAVYGPRDKATLDFFKAVSKGFIPLVGFKNKYISILYVSDVVDGLISAAENDKAVGEVFLLGSEKFYTWEEIGKAIENNTNHRTIKIRVPEFLVVLAALINNLLDIFREKPSVFNFEKSKDMIASAWIANIEKAKNHLSFKQKVDLEEGIRKTYEWYKKEGWI